MHCVARMIHQHALMNISVCSQQFRFVRTRQGSEEETAVCKYFIRVAALSSLSSLLLKSDYL